MDKKATDVYKRTLKDNGIHLFIYWNGELGYNITRRKSFLDMWRFFKNYNFNDNV